MANFYHLYFTPKADASIDDIKKKMDLGLDWLRINRNYWIVYSTSSAKIWSARLTDLLEPNGSILVIKLDISEYWGAMDKVVWDWLQKPRK
jgi:hypothetical protein